MARKRASRCDSTLKRTRSKSTGCQAAYQADSHLRTDDDETDEDDEVDFDQDYASDESGAGGAGAGFIDDEAEEASEDSDEDMEE